MVSVLRMVREESASDHVDVFTSVQLATWRSLGRSIAKVGYFRPVSLCCYIPKLLLLFVDVRALLYRPDSPRALTQRVTLMDDRGY